MRFRSTRVHVQKHDKFSCTVRKHRRSGERQQKQRKDNKQSREKGSPTIARGQFMPSWAIVKQLNIVPCSTPLPN